MIKRVIIFLLVLSICADTYNLSAQADQGAGSYQVILESIQSLESTKDPKCHATASRLEDFMFGTPLTPEAREARIDLQKKIVRLIWTAASTPDQEGEVSLQKINEISNELIKFFVQENKWYLALTDGRSLHITQRDYEHYSSIAYGLRSILAIQQEDLFGDRKLTALNKQAVERLKLIVDITSIGVLKLADYNARQEDRYQIEKKDLDYAWQLISKIKLTNAPVTKSKVPVNYDLTMAVIQQKLASYEEYNQISQKIFLRNIQVYFAQVPWPKDTMMGAQITTDFQDIMIEFTTKLLLDAQKLAVADEQQFIRHEDVRISLQALLPHSINEFEDVTFFERLDLPEQKRIEAYDLDAFRDSGVHWNYLAAGINNSASELMLEPNPYAMELLVEGIAQMGVLLWRVAGEDVLATESEFIEPEHLESAFREIKRLSLKSNRTPIKKVNEEIIRSITSFSVNRNDELFQDVTSSTGIDFEHRTSDWLSRQIRSYVLKDEDLVRLAIPPAFGGGGVAADDINHDGFADILLLGGRGVKLYLNKGDKSFTDITAQSGINWIREDGTKGEPRQPIIADFDNDGHKDIFISYVNDLHKIYKGHGNGTFSDATITANLGGTDLIGGPCTAFDYDRDGLLDLYIGYFGNYLNGELPTLKRHNDNGTPNKLFRNLGNFNFQDVTEESDVGNSGWTQAVGHADINNDGWQDVIVGNDFGVNAYYINNKDGSFTDQSTTLGVDKPSYTMNIGFTDLNADDLPDFYISNIVVMEKDDKYTAPNANTTMHFKPEVLANMRVVEANDLFVSQKQTSSYVQSKSIGRGYSSTGWAWDADFFDYDNDGDDDLYCLNGMNQYSVYSTLNPYYSSPDGEELDVIFSESKSAQNVFFENNAGFLQNRSAGSGLDLDHTSRSAAYLDYDNDGDLDIILNNYNGPAYFYENTSEELGNNWLAIDLKNNETSAKSLVGTKVKVTTDDGKNIWRQISSTTGYLSGHPERVHVGLGQSKACKIEILWPDDKKKSLRVKQLNRVIEIIK